MKLDHIIDQATLTAERIDLRPLRRSDKGLIELYASDLQLARMTTSIPHPLPPGLTEAFIARAMAPERDTDVWAMDGTRMGGGEVLGLVRLKRLGGNQAEIGYWVAPLCRNTGLASEAVAALLRDNPLGSEVIFASVFQDNPASARVLTQCGFVYLGDAESYSVARNANVPTWTYSRTLRL